MAVSLVSCGIFKSTGKMPPPERKPIDKRPEKPVNKASEKKRDSINLAEKKITDSLNQIYPITIKPSYTMSIFLPLYLHDSDRMQRHKIAISVGQDFYKGLLIAADTLKHCGKDLTLRVYDSENPFLTEFAIDDTIAQTHPDLLMGPLLDKTQLTYLDTLSKKYQINWVSPLQTAEGCMGSNYYIESLPSHITLAQKAAQDIMKEYANKRIIIVSQKSLNDNAMGKAFYNQFPSKDSILIVNYNGNSASTYDPDFSLSDTNVIYIASNNESFVTSVLSRLRIDSAQAVVFGTTSWLFFKSQEGDVWEKFNIHITTPFHLDYSNPALSGFIKNYRERYGEEPSLWAFIGFDEVTYYGLMLSRYGKYFQRYFLNNVPFSMLHSAYLLQPNKRCLGWKNNYVNILKFENYQMMKDEQ